MRRVLASQAGERKRFRAVFSRLGKKINYKGYREDTILLNDVREAESSRIATDHVWFSYTKAFEKIKLTEGCVIEFEARVKKYTKGYVNKRFNLSNRTIDFKLSNPTKIKLIVDLM
jgi:hypothetical protein